MVYKLKSTVFKLLSIILSRRFINARINGLSIISKQTLLGKNCHFNGVRIYGKGNVKIGDNFHSGQGLIVLTQNHIWDNPHDTLPYGGECRFKDTTIGNNVWVGMNVTLLPGTTIGEGSIIQAGSVLGGTYPPLSIIGSNRGKVFDFRDKKNYENRLNRP